MTEEESVEVPCICGAEVGQPSGPRTAATAHRRLVTGNGSRE